MSRASDVARRARARKLKVVHGDGSAKPDPDSTASEKKLLEMNGRYCVVSVGGKTRVASFEDGAPIYSTIHDFVAFHANERVEVRTDDGGVRNVGLGRWWINNPRRRQFSGIVYAPNSRPADRLNLWTGFSVEPREGDCDLFLGHVRDVICGGNAEHFQYVIGWMATAVQQPGAQGEVAMVLRGREGTGKGIFATTFGKLFGVHFLHILHAAHLVGNFNSHLQHCSVLFADEALFAGDRSHESVLKGLITEPTLLIEPKGVDSFMVRNNVHLIVASNVSWVIPAGADARRFFVVDVADTRMQDTKYFGALADQMANGGSAALLHYLLHHDLSAFNIRVVPQTVALADQKARSRRGVDRLVEMIANNGVLPWMHESHHDVAITTGEERGRGFYHAARMMVPDLKHESSIIIARTLKEWGCSPWHVRYRRGIRFPSLADLRTQFERKHGSQDWLQSEVTEWSAAPIDDPDDVVAE